MLIVTVPAVTSNTRSANPAPATTKVLIGFPCPTMLSDSVISKSPFAAVASAPVIERVYVPAGSRMVSAPAAAFAARMASRKEQSELQTPSLVSVNFVITKGELPAGVAVAVAADVAVDVLVGVLVGVLVAKDVGVLVAVFVAVEVRVAVGVLVGVLVGVIVAKDVGVLVAVFVAVGVLVGVLVTVEVDVTVAVAVGVGVLVGGFVPDISVVNRKTSATVFVSPLTKLLACDSTAIYFPLSEMDGA